MLSSWHIEWEKNPFLFFCLWVFSVKMIFISIWPHFNNVINKSITNAIGVFFNLFTSQKLGLSFNKRKWPMTKKQCLSKLTLEMISVLFFHVAHYMVA
ncbi:hypothetical protein C2G38_967277 [Gigaspora rosea]|uniref:Uncharacterized protein n=1 Tax=Gigaspora rosea TaxID=44941 RepID=A0A397WE86_9GLOM|nr:hypothetical protein C2G38_967277 [Gigaspora rosea]